MTGKVTPIESLDTFKQLINRPDVYTFIDFWATWCGPCRVISPVFEKLAAEGGKPVEFYKVDVDEASDIAQEVGIRAMPTFMLFKDGKKEQELVGANPGALSAIYAQIGA